MAALPRNHINSDRRLVQWPSRWGGPEDKDDTQLRLQAESLDHLGEELHQLEMVLAYHNHDAELRQGGREFHHMLTATNPANVKFCLEA